MMMMNNCPDCVEKAKAKEAARIKNITDLSLKYGVLSKQVSLVAVESRDVCEFDSFEEPTVMKVVEIPIQKFDPHAAPITGGGGAGWSSGLGGSVGYGGGGSSSVSSGSGGPPIMYMMMSNQGPRPSSESSFSGLQNGQVSPAKPAVVASSELTRLLNLQQWDGTWALTEELAKFGGVRVQELRELVKNTPANLDDDVIGTVLAVSVVEQKHRAMHDAWQQIVAKARDFLAKQPNQAALQNFVSQVLSLIK